MGLMDKVKKILFDEDEIEVPVKSDTLPKRETKKEEFPSRGSFINHHEQEEENPIKEIIVPAYEEKKEVPERKSFNFPDDDDFDFMPRIKEEEKVQEEVIRRREVTPEYSEFKRVETQTKVSREYGLQENKDYKKLIKDEEVKMKEEKEKKPFTVTPVISSVYGIINTENVERPKKEAKETVEIVQTRRNFGPVSYNDQPSIPKEEKNNVEVLEKVSIDDVVDDIDDENIQTSGIENEYLGNNSIEESFESTSELETINEEDSKFVEGEKVDYTPQTIEESEEEKRENEKLEDTIETDLFNLIDSMYKDDEDTGSDD